MRPEGQLNAGVHDAVIPAACCLYVIRIPFLPLKLRLYSGGACPSVSACASSSASSRNTTGKRP